MDSADFVRNIMGSVKGNAVKIIRYMQQHQLNTVPELVDHLADRWSQKSQ